MICLAPLVFCCSPDVGQLPTFWTLFGTSNQLLAGLSLLAVTVWLRRSGRRYAYTLVPALFVLAVTMTALVLQVQAALAGAVGWVARWNGFAAAALIALALVLFVATARAFRAPPRAAPAE